MTATSSGRTLAVRFKLAGLLGIFSVLNPELIGSNNISYFLLFFKLVFAFYFLAKVRIKHVDRESILLILGVIFILIHSLVFSFYPAVSIMKAWIYLVILLGFYSAFYGVRVGDVISALREFSIGFLLASLLVLPFPEIGYARDQMGFQGIVAHPQIFGIFAGLTLLVFADAVLQKTEKKNRLFYTACFLLMAALLLLSRARTGIVVFGVPVLFHIFLERGFVLQKGGLQLISASIFCGIFLLSLGFIDVSFFVEFFYKGNNSNFSEAFEASRGFLLAESIANLTRHPLTGLGFGVADSVFKPFLPVYDPIFGIPISAPTEKANIFVGVLEELGLILGIFTLATHLFFLKEVVFYGSRTLSWLSTGCYVSGISEFVFYSTNSLGYLYALLFIVAIRTVKNGRTSVYK